MRICNIRVWVDIVNMSNTKLICLFRTQHTGACRGEQVTDLNTISTIFGNLEKNIFFCVQRTGMYLVLFTGYLFVFVFKAIR